MPRIHHATREIQFKVVYYGPGLSGKTTNLEQIHQKSNPAHRGKLVSLTTESERTLFFDLLPIDLGSFRGYSVRLHLCTVPGQIALDETRRLVLRNVDGIVFVVDSQRERLDENLASLRNLEANLLLQGDDPSRMPLVVQYNKRDLPKAMTPAALRRELAIEARVRQVEACAVRGVGVFDTFKAITKGCMAVVGNPRDKPEGRSVSVLPGPANSSMFPLAAAGPLQDEVARAYAAQLGLELPKSPRLPRVDALG
ncbi:MAG: gliding motility protein MglA [Myxococcaceae bacterium]|nr:gliding motility protein MglA [Myxococcaceae bacterium]